jgi:hypothetical protein
MEPKFIPSVPTRRMSLSIHQKFNSLKRVNHSTFLNPRRRTASLIRKPFKGQVEGTNTFGSKKIASDSPIKLSEEDKKFQSMLSEAYCSKDLAALNDYLNNLSGRSELRDAEFFLRNLAQLAENKSHLAEWAYTYLIAQERLSATTENIQSYPFIIRVLSRINGWERQSLLEKYSHVCKQEAIYDPLFGNLIASFLHKIRIDKSKTFSFQARKFDLEINKTSKATVGGIDCMAISTRNLNEPKDLLIFSPSKIKQEKSSNFYSLLDLIESFTTNKNKVKSQAIVLNRKALFLLNEGQNIAIIEILTSKISKKIVIHDANFILRPEVIKEVKRIAKDNQYVFLSYSDDYFLGVSRLESYYDIKNCIYEFLLGTTVGVTYSDSMGVKNSILYEIKDNLGLTDRDNYKDDYLSMLFKVAIPWDAKEFVEWKDVFLKSKETPPFNKNSLKIAQQVSESMLYIPDSVQSKCAKECVSISDVNIILLRFYCNLLNEIKNAQLADKSKKITIPQFFAKKNNPEVPESFSRIHLFLLSKRFAEMTDLRDLFSKQLEQKSFSKKYISYVTTYNSYVDQIPSPNPNHFYLKKTSNRDRH